MSVPGEPSVPPEDSEALQALFDKGLCDLVGEAKAMSHPGSASSRAAGQGLLSVDQAWSILKAVPDPEIPVVSVVDLGIVRDVAVLEADDGGGMLCQVTVTPTYSGCPATAVIARSIEQALVQAGFAQVKVLTQIAPAWTTDWMSPQAREALRGFGITPPAVQVVDVSGLKSRSFQRGASLQTTQDEVRCPRCGSASTRLVSGFGSTPCKALYQCKACQEPFDYFKPH